MIDDVNSSIDSLGNTALNICCCKTPTYENIFNLLSIGANVNIPNDRGWTPLLNLAKKFDGPVPIDVYKLIIDMNADINYKTDKYGWTALMLAGRRHDTDHIVYFLIQNGGDINIEDDSGHTLLNHINFTNKKQMKNNLIENILKMGGKYKKDTKEDIETLISIENKILREKIHEKKMIFSIFNEYKLL